MRTAWWLAALLGGCGSLIGVDDLVFDRPEGMIAYEDKDGGALFIDPAEVTNAEYAAWLATEPALATDASCGWNTSYEPGDTTANGELGADCANDRYDWTIAARDLPRRPVACIDWCDAAAYCAGQGKRLCGGIDGATASIRYDATAGSFVTDAPEASAWFRACTAGESRAYPYGDTYDASACNGDGGESLDVATRARCEGGYPGVLDMSGNIEEWEDACTDASDGAACARRGGAYYSAQIYDPSWLRCDFILPAARKSMALSIGVRCCWEP